MNKNCLIAAALLAVAGCQKENGTPEKGGVKDTIKAFIADNDATKTTATPSADGKSLDFTWAKGDEIAVVTATASDDTWGKLVRSYTDGNTGEVKNIYSAYKYTLVGEGGNKEGSFTSEDGTPDGDKYVAVYPYSATSGVTRARENSPWINFCYTIPAEQNYVENGFDTKYAVMYALSDSRDNMEFKHLSSVLNLKVHAKDGCEGVKVTGIKVTADTKLQAICGLSYFQKKVNDVTISHYLGYNNTTKTIVYNVPSIELGSKDVEFNIVFNPACVGWDDNGTSCKFTFEILTNGGSITKTKTITVNRGVVYRMPSIEVDVEPAAAYHFNGDVSAKDIDSFVEGTDGFTSLAVKSQYSTVALSENDLKTIKSYIDTYGSSEGVALDLSAASYASTTWPITFRGCTKLKSISLPMNITDGSGSTKDKLSKPFDGCTMLSEIILDEAMLRLPDEFLSGLANLTDFNITKNVYGIVWLQNQNVDRLENITVDSENKNLYAKDGVLYRIKNGENSLEYVPVSNTAALTKEGDNYVYTLPDDVNYIQQAAFHCNRNITKIVFGNNFKEITGGYCLGTNKLKVIDFSQLDHVPVVTPDASTIKITPKGGEIWCASDAMLKKFEADAKWKAIAEQSGWTFKVKPVDSSSSASISNMDSVNADFTWK